MLNLIIIIGAFQYLGAIQYLNEQFFKDKDIEDLQLYSSVSGVTNGFYSLSDIQMTIKYLETEFPYAITRSGVLKYKSRNNKEISYLTISLDENFDYIKNKKSLNDQQKVTISKKPEVVIFGYVGGNEGASLTSVIYFTHLLLWSIVKQEIEIINLLKKLQITIVPAVNVDRLFEKRFNFHALHLKNARYSENNCPQDGDNGVNLRLNFGGGTTQEGVGPCNQSYSGDGQIEPEVKSLLSLIERHSTKLAIGIFNGENTLRFSSGSHLKKGLTEFALGIFKIAEQPKNSFPEICHTKYNKICLALDFMDSKHTQDFFKANIIELRLKMHKALKMVMKSISLVIFSPQFKFEILCINICKFGKMEKDLCSKFQQVHFLRVSVTNAGMSDGDNLTALCELPDHYIIKKILKNGTKSIKFAESPYSYSLGVRRFEFEVFAMKVGESMSFTILFVLEDNEELKGTDELILNLKGHEKSLFKLYEKKRLVVSMISKMPVNNFTTSVSNPIQVSPTKLSNFEQRKVSFYLLFGYFAVFCVFVATVGYLEYKIYKKNKLKERYQDNLKKPI